MQPSVVVLDPMARQVDQEQVIQAAISKEPLHRPPHNVRRLVDHLLDVEVTDGRVSEHSGKLGGVLGRGTQASKRLVLMGPSGDDKCLAAAPHARSLLGVLVNEGFNKLALFRARHLRQFQGIAIDRHRSAADRPVLQPTVNERHDSFQGSRSCSYD
jgi:hypothetical protein